MAPQQCPLLTGRANSKGCFSVHRPALLCVGVYSYALNPCPCTALQVGPWVIDRQLGEGTTSKVFLAHHSQDGQRQCAIKIVDMTGAIMKNVEREVRALLQENV